MKEVIGFVEGSVLGPPADTLLMYFSGLLNLELSTERVQYVCPLDE